MTIGQWLGFQGRIGRRTFWLAYALPLFLASLVAGILDVVLGFVPTGLDAVPADAAQPGPVSSLVSVLSIWPSLAGSIKRLHDRDRSGWWIGGFYLLAAVLGAAGLMATMTAGQGDTSVATLLVVGLVVLLGYALWMLVELGFLRGTPGPNRFGPDPLGGIGMPQWQPGMPPPGWQQAPPWQQQPQWQPPSGPGWQPPPQGYPPPQPGYGAPPPGYGQTSPGGPPPGYGQPPQAPPGQWSGPGAGGSVPPVRRD